MVDPLTPRLFADGRAQTTPHSTTTRRLHFYTSSRLSHHLHSTALLLAQTSALLSGATPDAFPERIAQLTDANKTNHAAAKGLRSELAALLGAGLRERLEQGSGRVYEHRDAGGETSGGTDFLGLVAGVVFPPAASKGEEVKGKLLVLSACPAPFTVRLFAFSIPSWLE